MTDPSYTPQYQANANPAAQDPGQTLGIVGLVLAFVFPLAGIIVSVIARNKSREAGFENKLAKYGLIIAIVMMVLSIILTIVYAVAAASMMSQMPS